jgi:hypothetical protein
VRWLVDGMNVIGSRPTGWWRDRPAAMRQLTTELERFARRKGDELTVMAAGAQTLGAGASRRRLEGRGSG